MSDKKSCKNKISTANYCLLAQESVTTGKRRERRVAKTEELYNRQSSFLIACIFIIMKFIKILQKEKKPESQ